MRHHQRLLMLVCRCVHELHALNLKVVVVVVVVASNPLLQQRLCQSGKLSCPVHEPADLKQVRHRLLHRQHPPRRCLHGVWNFSVLAQLARNRGPESNGLPDGRAILNLCGVQNSTCNAKPRLLQPQLFQGMTPKKTLDLTFLAPLRSARNHFRLQMYLHPCRRQL